MRVRGVIPRHRRGHGRLLGDIGDAVASVLDALLAVVLFVLLVSETVLSTGSGIDPRQIWRPTELENTLAWNLKTIPRPTSYAVRVITIDSPLQTQSSEIHEKDFVDPEDDPDASSQNVPSSGSSLDLQQPEPAVDILNSPSVFGLGINLFPSIPASNAAARIVCEFPDCEKTFEHRHEYHRHKKSHTRPAKCTHCGAGFETSKDVSRHINSIHAPTKLFFCTFQRCKFSRSSADSHGFPRKDNWRRHMKSRHGLGRDAVLGLEAMAEVN